MQIDWAHFTPWAALVGGLLLGVASALFILVNGRILGISGIVGGLLNPRRGDTGWRVSFVLGMLAAFYSRQRNLITLPLFIAMTALSRLIVLQGKETDPVVLLYESCAILLIAAACWIVSRMRADD